MKKLAIIGANEFQQRLILKAKDMGLETHVFAWEEGAVGAADADYFYPISIVEKEKILEKCREIGIDGITSIGSDLAVLTVNYVAEKMMLPGNSITSGDVCTNKYRMRQKLQEAGLPVPRFKRVYTFQEADLSMFSYPIIVKPTDRSGSRSITKLEEPDDSVLQQALEDAIGVSFEQCAIVEEYLEGEEFSCECISYQGRHTILAVTKKYTTGAPNFIETGHMEPAVLQAADYEEIKKTVFYALSALSIENGASHSEFKLCNGEVKIIEIGARMGGDFIGSDLVYHATGLDYLKMTIDISLGNAPEFRAEHPGKPTFIRFIFTQDDVEKWKQHKKEYTILCESNIDAIKFHPVIDSSSRLGYYIYQEK